jgi:hypothetical protein
LLLIFYLLAQRHTATCLRCAPVVEVSLEHQQAAGGQLSMQIRGKLQHTRVQEACMTGQQQQQQQVLSDDIIQQWLICIRTV